MATPSVRTSPRKRMVFRLLAIALGLIPLLVLELTLYGLGLGQPTQATEDPLVGFSELHPLFEKDLQEGVYRTARSRQLFFGAQEFPIVKGKDTFRVFCLGGSTVRGHPFETNTAFAQWMQLELAACDASRRYEVINCGGISYASYRLRILLNEVLQYQPDLIVIATGHNEFLEDRTYHAIKSRSPLRAWLEDRVNSLRTVNLIRQTWHQDSEAVVRNCGKTILADKVVTRLDELNGYASYRRDESWRDDVIEHFAVSLRGMVAACRQAKVPAMLVRLGSNLRSTPPFKSEHRADLSVADLLTWQAAFDTASGLDGDDDAKALEFYLKAEKIDDGYALLHYRLARCYDRLQQFGTAKRYYLTAKDLDICPLRMITPIAERVTEVAAESQLPLVDAEALFQHLGDEGIPGDDWYVDHVHPSIRGYQLIGQETVAQIRAQPYGSALRPWAEDARQRVYSLHLDSLGETYWAQGRERVAWLEGWAQRHRLFYESLPVNGSEFLRRGMRRFNFNNEQGALVDFGKALELDVNLRDRLRKFSEEVQREGRPVSSQKLKEWLLFPATNSVGPLPAVSHDLQEVGRDK
jgi:hypothetical protein